MLARSLATRVCAVLFGLAVVPLVVGCNGGESDPDHGYVKLQFRRVLSEDASPYQNTTQADIQLVYDTCIREFYASNPNWLQDGVDGAGAFMEFADPDSKSYLCRQNDPSRGEVDCDVAMIDQRADTGRLRVVYDINEPDMEEKVLFFGPIPCEKLTGCRPIVSLSGGSAVGRSGQAQNWHYETVQNPNAVGCEPGAPIVVNAASDGS